METDAAPHRTVVEGTTPEGTSTPGYVEYTVQGNVLRKEEDVLHIEEAELQRGVEGDEDEISVQAVVRGPADGRDCLLMEGPTWFALKRLIETGDVPEDPGRIESLWADELSSEVFSSGETYVEIFQEDERHEGRAVDPREMPLFALCLKVIVPSGADSATTWYDVAHVEGTPQPS